LRAGGGERGAEQVERLGRARYARSVLGEQLAAPMDWEPIVAVLIFVAGLAWNRHDGDRRERRARLAEALAVFEQLQRETHLELRDTLAKTVQAAARAAETRRTRASEAHQTRAALDESHAAAHRAAVLESRVANSDIRMLVVAAIESSKSLAHATGAKIQEATDTAEDAMDEAILELGGLISRPPTA
jgi:hypothetical protein